MTKTNFMKKYEKSSLKPDIYLYQCFIELLSPKFANKKDTLLNDLLANGVFIPDTLIQYEGVESATRIMLDQDQQKYVISQGEHVQSLYYN